MSLVEHLLRPLDAAADSALPCRASNWCVRSCRPSRKRMSTARTNQIATRPMLPAGAAHSSLRQTAAVRAAISQLGQAAAQAEGCRKNQNRQAKGGVTQPFDQGKRTGAEHVKREAMDRHGQQPRHAGQCLQQADPQVTDGEADVLPDVVDERLQGEQHAEGAARAACSLVLMKSAIGLLLSKTSPNGQ